MTDVLAWANADTIIPYQELLGNYDDYIHADKHQNIIPYQELLGNYDSSLISSSLSLIIPYQELLGNYDLLPCLPVR